jgi:hypothetical protein
MTNVIAEPQTMATVAADLERIGSAINSARAAAAGPTSRLVAAAADEVSAAIAKVFGAYGQQYQAAVRQVAAFHDEFTRTLAAATSASITMSPLTSPAVALVMGGSGSPIPAADYVSVILDYATPQFTLSNAQTLFTPEQLYPITGEKSLPLTTSVSQGVTMLHDAILNQINTQGNSVVVVGYSQSAIIASLEMRHLAALGPAAPTADQLGFVLLADPMNPNGGLLSRFAGLSLPSLGVDFFGATPADTIYPTIYTHEYDGFADFPRYPLNIVSDLNAIAGIALVHSDTRGREQH